MWLWVLLAGCGAEADLSRLPDVPSPPVVPPLPEEVPTGQSRAFELNVGGGGSGAPFGMNLFVPPGAVGSVRVGVLSDGQKGGTMTVPTAGDSVMCTSPVALHGPVTVGARMRVTELSPTTDDWSGLDVELRARDAAGALVSPEGSRFQRVKQVRSAGDWEAWTLPVTPPEGAVKGELCWRFVKATGTVEVDRAEVVTDGVPLPPPIPIVAVEWPLNEGGGGSGAPRGFDFLIPPGTTGVTLESGALAGGATGIQMAVTKAGNAVTCSQAFTVASGMVARARVKVESLETDQRPWTGFVTEVRAYNLIGELTSPTGTPFTLVQAIKAPGDWQEVEQAFAPPADAVTGKLCFRFVESTGVALIDQASVGE